MKQMGERFPKRRAALAAALLGGLAVFNYWPGGAPDAIALSSGPLVEPVVWPEPFREIALRCQGRRVPVIMYHDVIPRRHSGSMWYDVTAAEFEAQMRELKSRGRTPISLEQLYRHLTLGESVPEGAVVLTFDDNYQGFYDIALPILRRYGYPSAMFVHTGFVGSPQGRPKMGWATLRKLAQSDDVTIGSHTITHPEDLGKLSEEAQIRELTESKRVLEERLDLPIHFLAYPNGGNSERTRRLARRAGYRMAFTIENRLAQESPSILAVGRYVHTRLELALAEQERTTELAPAGLVQIPLDRQSDVSRIEGRFGGISLVMVQGGDPQTLRSSGRQGVAAFVRQAGAKAGINGTFFTMAAVQGTDNGMVGPVRVSNEPQFVIDGLKHRLPRLRNRPLVVWGPRRIAFLTFQPETMNDEDPIREFMPEYTNCFVGGGWIVHRGQARTSRELDSFAARDYLDARKRAFFGVTGDGRVVLGCSTRSVTTVQLARAAAEAGVAEAVLLDSGFSTSLVFEGEVLVTGHASMDNPSRPVPHAIVVR